MNFKHIFAISMLLMVLVVACAPKQPAQPITVPPTEPAAPTTEAELPEEFQTDLDEAIADLEELEDLEE